jgi:hypothetical protein
MFLWWESLLKVFLVVSKHVEDKKLRKQISAAFLAIAAKSILGFAVGVDEGVDVAVEVTLGVGVLLTETEGVGVREKEGEGVDEGLGVGDFDAVGVVEGVLEGVGATATLNEGEFPV